MLCSKQGTRKGLRFSQLIPFWSNCPCWDFLGLLICFLEHFSQSRTVGISSVAILVQGSPTFFPQNDWTIWKFRSYMLWLGCVNCFTQTLMNASMLTLAWRIPSVITQKAAMTAFAKLDLKKARRANASVSIPQCSRWYCTVTLWCSMTDRLSGSKWETLFLVRGVRRAWNISVTHAFTRGACLALHARFVLRSFEKPRDHK